MKKHIANIMTSVRIFGSVCMLCTSAFSPQFYIVYLFCGFTDMIDGTIARKANSVSTFGSHLDSIADLIFLTAACIKILPAIYMPNWIWCGALIVFLVKTAALVWKYELVHKFVLEHTRMNKITGFLLFIMPLSLPFIEIRYSAGMVCAVAFISAIHELMVVLSGDNL